MFMGIMELELPNRDAPLDEKQQTSWFDLPYEMRMMIIETMDTKTKGKLSCCSKLCCEEVRRSKNFIKNIKIMWYQTEVDLKVGIQNDNCINIKFSKVTENAKERCLMRYKICNSHPENLISQWERTVDGSVEDIALNYFNRYVNDAVHLEEMVIHSDGFLFDKTSIRHLRKLDTIQIIQPPGLQKNLLECGFLSITQLTSASKHVYMIGIRIEIDQLISFKASTITIIDVKFSSAQLNQYLKSWNENEIDANVKQINMVWCSMQKEPINIVDDIISGLKVVYNYDNGHGHIKIENNVGKLAKLLIGGDSFFANFNGLEDENEEEFYDSDEDEEELYDSDEDDYDYDSDTNSDN